MHAPLAARLAALRRRIAAAAVAAGRDPADVALLPVSKTFGVDVIREAVALGLTRFGENKAQEIREKAPALADTGVRWVMIGHLQTNKAREIARLASEVQSLDRVELARALDRRLQLEGRSLDVLVQVKTSEEPGKYGMAADAVAGFLRTIAAEMPTLRVRGLMTLAVTSDDADLVRGCFRRLRELRDRLRQEAPDGIVMDELSMGMSGDFEMAIEEGATTVRVGTAIFGARPTADSEYWPGFAGKKDA